MASAGPGSARLGMLPSHTSMQTRSWKKPIVAVIQDLVTCDPAEPSGAAWPVAPGRRSPTGTAVPAAVACGGSTARCGDDGGRAAGPGQANLRQAVVQRGKVPEIHVAAGADDRQTAALEVEGQVPHVPDPQWEVQQPLERQSVAQHRAIMAPPVASRRPSGLTARQSHAAVMRFSRRGPVREVGERDAADRPAPKPDHQAAAARSATKFQMSHASRSTFFSS